VMSHNACRNESDTLFLRVPSQSRMLPYPQDNVCEGVDRFTLPIDFISIHTVKIMANSNIGKLSISECGKRRREPTFPTRHNP